jgi:hypothetical protein
MTTKQIINSWKNAENAISENNPVGNANVDSDILNRVLGGQDNITITGCCIPDLNPFPKFPFPFPDGNGDGGTCPGGGDDILITF